MNFPVGAYTNTFKFRRDMASIWCLSQALAGLLEFKQQMVSPAPSVGPQDIFVDFKNVLFGLRDNEHLILHGRSFVRAARSANAFLSGLCLPASTLLWLWASSLSMARLSWVCS